MGDTPLVCIVIVNFNGWEDTLECLESLLRMEYDHFQIVLVDNASNNNSIENIKNWATGNLNIHLHKENPLKSKSFPPYQKPIEFKEYHQDEDLSDVPLFKNKYLFILKSAKNGGFAAGNNIGIRFSLLFKDLEYLWLLNNDTVVARDALTQLVQQHLKYKKSKVKIGLMGSKLLHYYNPQVIQAVGGSYNQFLGTVKQYGSKFSHDINPDKIELSEIDFVVGASMFLPVDFVKEVGLMAEDYFLYFEELDWVQRGKALGWKLDFCYTSCVYHKEGASTGSTNKNGKSFIADYYDLRNRIIFTRKYYPNFKFTVYAGFIPVIIKRIFRGQFDRIGKIMKLIWETR